MRRHKVSKHHSAKKFNRHGKRTKAANLNTAPMRGGYRF